jgi:hypothetical protein
MIAIFTLLTLQQQAFATSRYGETLCDKTDYFCIKIKQGDSWDKLFPNYEEQDIVRRINRMNINLKAGMNIAVPKNIEYLTIYDVSPFPRYIEINNEKAIYVSQKKWLGELMMNQAS